MAPNHYPRGRQVITWSLPSRFVPAYVISRATLRMLLLRITHRPLVIPSIPERDVDPSQLQDKAPSSSTSSASEREASPTPNHLQNNHVPPPHHPILSPDSSMTAEDFLLPKALTKDSVRPAISLIRPLSGPRDWLAETIYILRPLVYGLQIPIFFGFYLFTRFPACLLVVDRKSKERSNRALIIALTMELLSRSLRRSPSSSALLERSEYARRDRDMLWYLLRGSIWEDYTRSV